MTADQWKTIAIDHHESTFPLTARICLGAASLDTRHILLLGGNDALGTDLKDAYVFDLKSERLERVARDNQ